MDNKLLSINDISRLLGIARETLWRMRKRGEFIKEIRVSPRKVLFFEDDFLEWLRR
jgi:predicted DNA-binding transcriptional regulator AlpA